MTLHCLFSWQTVIQLVYSVAGNQRYKFIPRSQAPAAFAFPRYKSREKQPWTSLYSGRATIDNFASGFEASWPELELEIGFIVIIPSTTFDQS